MCIYLYRQIYFDHIKLQYSHPSFWWFATCQKYISAEFSKNKQLSSISWKASVCSLLLWFLSAILFPLTTWGKDFGYLSSTYRYGTRSVVEIQTWCSQRFLAEFLALLRNDGDSTKLSHREPSCKWLGNWHTRGQQGVGSPLHLDFPCDFRGANGGQRFTHTRRSKWCLWQSQD